MSWYEYETYYASTKKSQPADAFFIDSLGFTEHISKRFFEAGKNNEAIAIIAEQYWKEAKKPYYNIWPCIAEALANTSLDFDCEYIIEGQEYLKTKHGIQTILLRWKKGGRHIIGTALAWIRPWKDKFVMSIRSMPTEKGNCYWDDTLILTPGKSLLECKNEAYDKHNPLLAKEEIEALEDLFKIVTAIFIMARDPDSEILTPIVMNKDQSNYDLNKDQKYVERAKKRGLVGWNVGAHIEFSPHMRRPHFGLRWTGRGRAIPKIVPIKGCIVRRNKMTEVPTGYLGTAKQEISLNGKT